MTFTAASVSSLRRSPEGKQDFSSLTVWTPAEERYVAGLFLLFLTPVSNIRTLSKFDRAALKNCLLHAKLWLKRNSSIQKIKLLRSFNSSLHHVWVQWRSRISSHTVLPPPPHRGDDADSPSEKIRRVCLSFNHISLLSPSQHPGPVGTKSLSTQMDTTQNIGSCREKCVKIADYLASLCNCTAVEIC